MMGKIAAICFIVLINSCASSRQSLAVSSSTLNGKTFQLVNVFEDVGITISFYNGEFYGYSGFNTYFGEYEIRRGNNIVFKSVSVTKIGDESEGQEIENSYLEYINRASSLELTSDGMKINTLDGKELIYKRLR